MLTEDQKKAYEAMCSGENIYLTGSAGTGKTFVVNQFIKEHENSTIVCAPTGLAAQQIGGATIHRVFNLSTGPCPDPGRKHLKTLVGARTVIIDEISMVRMDIFDYVCEIIRNMEKKLGHSIQLIVVGDFYQLPPVLKEEDREILTKHYGREIGNAYAFQSDSWKNMNFKPCILKEIIRQDDVQFSELLDQVKVGNAAAVREIKRISDKNIRTGKAVRICSINREAEAINEMYLSRIDEPLKTFDTEIHGDVRPDDIPFLSLAVKKGCRVMCTANYSADVKNGTFGTVTDITVNWWAYEDEIKVRWDNGKTLYMTRTSTTVYTYKLVDQKGQKPRVERTVAGSYEQFPLRLAYAITIHKSQGQTLDYVNLYASNVFAPGQLYVGLSRVKSLERLAIIGEINYRCLASHDVIDFYDSLLEEENGVASQAAPEEMCEATSDSPEITVIQATKKQVARRGRKSIWGGMDTKLVRIPVALEEEVLRYAHHLASQLLQDDNQG